MPLIRHLQAEVPGKLGVWSIWVWKSEKQGGCCCKSWSEGPRTRSSNVYGQEKKGQGVPVPEESKNSPYLCLLLHSHSRSIERCSRLQRWWGCISIQYFKSHVSPYQRHLTDVPRNVLAIILKAYKPCKWGQRDTWIFVNVTVLQLKAFNCEPALTSTGEILSSRFLAAPKKFMIFRLCHVFFCDTYFVMLSLWFQSKSHE